jgi:glycosyltransferase involved in cell wall biosynthesis
VNIKPPKLSIVTPSHNQGQFLEDAIQAVLKQDHPTFEHIIIDNCSTDSTIEILQKYQHLKWISEPDEGQSDALNKGFRMASGDIIGWLNADDLYLPNCFHTIASFLGRHPDVDIVYGDYRWIDQSGLPIALRRELDFDLFMLKYLHILYIPTTSTFFKRKILEENNFIDITYHYAMDYEFFLRLALKGYKFAHLKAFVADYRWHTTSKTSLAASKQSMEIERALMELDHFMAIFKHSGLKKIVKKILTILARSKRYFLKAINGYFFTQWPRGRNIQ